MRKAIVIGYCEDQNEPSRPDSKLFEVPDDPQERDELLRAEYRANFCEPEDEPEDCCFESWDDISITEYKEDHPRRQHGRR